MYASPPNLRQSFQEVDPTNGDKSTDFQQVQNVGNDIFPSQESQWNYMSSTSKVTHQVLTTDSSFDNSPKYEMPYSKFENEASDKNSTSIHVPIASSPTISQNSQSSPYGFRSSPMQPFKYTGKNVGEGEIMNLYSDPYPGSTRVVSSLDHVNNSFSSHAFATTPSTGYQLGAIAERHQSFTVQNNSSNMLGANSIRDHNFNTMTGQAPIGNQLSSNISSTPSLTPYESLESFQENSSTSNHLFQQQQTATKDPQNLPLSMLLARPKKSTDKRIDSNDSLASPSRNYTVDASAAPPIFYTSKGSPPPIITDFVSIDDGNASPNFMRFTMYGIPEAKGEFKKSFSTLGAVISPLYDSTNIDTRNPDNADIVRFIHGREPVRCSRCRAYISCHAYFVDMGKNWICPYCSMLNEVASSYFCNIDPKTNYRLDRDQKPELRYGTVEWDVSDFPNYNYFFSDMKKPLLPSPERYLFAINISTGKREFLSDYLYSIKIVLQEMSRKYPMCQVSFFTFSSTLHFYDFSHPSVPQIVVPDVENPFVPIPFNALCWLSFDQDMHKIEAFLDRLESVSTGLTEDSSAFGAAAKVARLILNDSGGKVILNGFKTPDVGCGKLKLRDWQSLYEGKNEKSLFSPMGEFWPTLADSCAAHAISFDILMCTNEYCDMATLGYICGRTNGTYKLFLNYSSYRNLSALQCFIRNSLLLESGYAGLLRVRCSQNISISRYYGHFHKTNDTDMDLANIQSNNVFAVEFSHDGFIKGNNVFFQVALLYTTKTGKRVVRVISSAVKVVKEYRKVFLYADFESTLYVELQRMISDVQKHGLQKAREESYFRLVDLLVAYRKLHRSPKKRELLLPDSLKLLFCFVLCAQKTFGLMAGVNVRLDERVQSLFSLSSISLKKMVLTLYPTMYGLHHLGIHSSHGTYHPDSHRCIFPVQQMLNSDSIYKSGIYALRDIQTSSVYVWIGSKADPEILRNLFGTVEVKDLFDFSTIENFHPRVQVILRELLKVDGNDNLQIVFTHEDDPTEELFFSSLLEDKGPAQMPSYPDWLVKLYRSVEMRQF